MTAINGTLYFSASDGIRGGQDHGTEVWVTDGSNTHMLADINPGKGNSDPAEFTLVDGEIYFSATDGTKAGAHGRELWKLEATGASLVMDINPGARDSSPRELKDYDGVLLFAADDGIHGYEPWRSDGSAGGTFMIEDINPVGSSFPINHARVNPLFFLADDGNGYELWRSDGTAQGTVKVSDVESAGQRASSQGPVIANNPIEGSNPQNLDPNTNDQVPESSPALDATISTISVAAAKTSFVPNQGLENSRSSYEVSSGGAVENSDLPLYEKVSRDYENRHKEGGDNSSSDHLIPEMTKVVILTAGHYSISSNSITMTITPNVWLPDIVEWYLIAMSEGRYQSGTLPPEHERMIWDFLSYLQTRKEESESGIGEMELRLAWQWAEWRKQLSATDGTADPLPWSYFRGLSQALTLFYGRGDTPVDYAEAIHALQHNAGRLSIIPLTLPNGTDVPNISDISKYISNSGVGKKE
jgi:ELWxxDGT repeat protein